MLAAAYNSSPLKMLAEGSQVQGHSWLSSNLEASLKEKENTKTVSRAAEFFLTCGDAYAERSISVLLCRRALHGDSTGAVGS